VIEEDAAADSGVAINITDQTLTASCILNFADEAIKSEWLPPLARGDMLGAFSLTEPDAGSDAAGLRTRAILDGDHWVIDGAKQFITNAGTRLTKPIVLLARTGERDDGAPELSMLLVPMDAKGVSVGQPYAKMGWRCSDTRPVSFDGVRIPAENLIGPRGNGLKQMLTMLDGGRIGVASNAIGLARACLDAARDYANGRRQFGRPLSAFQATQFKLADMATNIELARLITHKAARLADAGLPHRLEASMAKLHATRTAKAAADEAVHPWRQRFHGRLCRLALLAHGEGARDRRGHQRNPESGDRARDRRGGIGRVRPHPRHRDSSASKTSLHRREA